MTKKHCKNEETRYNYSLTSLLRLYLLNEGFALYMFDCCDVICNHKSVFSRVHQY
jgi:hypothetical protein